MTKEELKKEAEESFEQYKVTDEDYVVSPYSDDMGEKMLMFNYEYEAEEDYLRLYTQGYLAGAEPREKRIAELEAEVKEWKDKADLWCKTANLKDHNIMINKDLEKENAKLKSIADFQQSGNMSRYFELKRQAEKLEEAKELLKKLLVHSKRYIWIADDNNKPVMQKEIAEAEQFLKGE